MDIKAIMSEHGVIPSELARRMNRSATSIGQVINGGNPTVEMLQKLAEKLECHRWEFFLDEIRAAGFDIVKAQPEQPEQSASEKQSQESTNENPQPSAIGQQAIVCPHCHQALVFNIESYEQK